AVNPEDKRYAKFVGKMLLLPLTHRRIPVIADPYVTLDFGTGALKVTPNTASKCRVMEISSTSPRRSDWFSRARRLREMGT
ncbi:MAG: class I tRNA ligase family protein, partial [Sulfuricella sp.]|nr:class I tRNA ligase family protein [Sulfuricella sp.]